MLEEALFNLERMQQEIARMNEELREMSERLRQMKTEALKIAEKLYLNCTYEAFARAEEAAQKYEKYLYRLISGHELFLQIVLRQRELEERMEDLDGDMDQIRYDAGNTERALRKEQQEHASVLEQLKLTDYEKIKNRLDSCMEWLREYPQRLKDCVEERTRNLEQIKNLRLRLEEEQKKIEEYRRRGGFLETCYLAEKGLGYVNFPQEMEKEEFSAGKVREFLSWTARICRRTM